MVRIGKSKLCESDFFKQITDKLTKIYYYNDDELIYIGKQTFITCKACKEGQPNQMAHMFYGGCMSDEPKPKKFKWNKTNLIKTAETMKVSVDKIKRYIRRTTK